MPARWDHQREEELIRLVKIGRYTYGEIAEQMGLTKHQIATKANYLGLKNPTYLKRVTKHKHIREPVMKYFLTHTWEETREHFNLSHRELKSIFTVSYRDPKLKHLRKETRPHSAWSDQDWIFMLRHSGVMPREWIAKRLKRGQTYNSVKDALAKFRGYGKYMNGMPVGWAVHFLEVSELSHAIRMKAGPTGHHGEFRFRLIPWVTLERLIKGRRMSPEVRTGIQAMARFQRFIHGTQNEKTIRRRILKVVTS
jgi:hypothetical protein